MKKMIFGFICGAVLFGSVGVAWAASTKDNDVWAKPTGKKDAVLSNVRYTDYFTGEDGSKEREFTAYEFLWQGQLCLLVDEVGSAGGQTMTCKQG